MTDNSSTVFFDNEVHYPLKKITCDGNSFHLLDLTKSNTVITGNKAWKLKYNLEEWKASGANKLLTFGGAYSNHIYQTAKLGFHLGVPTIGLIRGEIEDAQNPTLKDARSWGMELVAIDRSDYRRWKTPDGMKELQRRYKAYIVPEGGTNAAAIKGTTELGHYVDQICEENGIGHVGIPVGTGGTIAGIIQGTNNRHVVGFGALKGNFLKTDVQRWVSACTSKWEILDDQIFGGYGKWNMELIEYIQSFYDQTDVVLDPIYTGKMIFAAGKMDLLKEEYLYIHTGGLQGNRGFNQRFDLNLPTT